MGMILRGLAAAATPPRDLHLPDKGIRYLVVTQADRSDFPALVELHCPGVNDCLGRITIASYGVKLEAIDDTLSIYPGHTDSADFSPQLRKYELQPSIGTHAEAIFLRPGDRIASPLSSISLVCVWDEFEVQVNSSVTGELHGTDKIFQEDDPLGDDLNQVGVTISATQTKSQQSRSTPRRAHQKAIIVQETPTAARIKSVARFSPSATNEEDKSTVLDAVHLPKTGDDAEADEAFSTARDGGSQQPNTDSFTGDEGDSNNILEHEDNTSRNTLSSRADGPHLQVVIPAKNSNKRLAFDPNKLEAESSDRSSKRVKTSTSGSGDVKCTHMSNAIVDSSHKATPRSRREQPNTYEMKNETPSRLQRSSQRSDKDSTTAHDGQAPHVAFSNSAIQSSNHAIKFLKKQKGVVVESIGRKCNVLCVRPGALSKTMKLLECIALGIPVVTDTWLLDSARAGHFLPLDEYRPHVEVQEKEWKFELEKVWGQPQLPFRGYVIYFTAELQNSYSNFDEIKEVCKTAGAKMTTKKTCKGENSIFLGTDGNDREVVDLIQEGTRCFDKGIIAHSILRGEVNLDSNEFIIRKGKRRKETVTNAPKESKKSSRKSQ